MKKKGHQKDPEPRPSPSRHFFQISDMDLLVGWMLQLKCSKNTTVGYVPKHGNGEQGGPGQVNRCGRLGSTSLRVVTKKGDIIVGGASFDDIHMATQVQQWNNLRISSCGCVLKALLDPRHADTFSELIPEPESTGHQSFMLLVS